MLLPDSMLLRAASCAFLMLLPALAGCANPQFSWPTTLLNDQTESQQVGEAKRFDIYPDPNTGPPVVGGRPLAYLTPRAQPDVDKNGRAYLSPYPSAEPYVGGYPAAYPPPPGYYPGAAAPYPSGTLYPSGAGAPYPPAGVAAPSYAATSYPSSIYPAQTNSMPLTSAPPTSGLSASSASTGIPSYAPPGGYSNSTSMPPVYPLPGSSMPAASSGSFAPNVSAPAAASFGPTAAVPGTNYAPATSGPAYGTAIKPMP